MNKEEVERCIREIREASYGKEAREPIARVMEEIDRKLEEEDQENAEEVREARKEFDTIGGRIDNYAGYLGTGGLPERLEYLKTILEGRQQE